MLTRNTLGLATLAAVLAFTHTAADAADLLNKGDSILAISQGLATQSASPGAEQVPLAFDGNTGTKYLNFGDFDTGFIITPATATELNSFILTTANDASGRDPATFSLWGTNDTITTEAHGNGREDNWTSIVTDGMLMPPPVNSFMTDYPAVNVANDTAYSSYKMTFTTRTPDIGLMQVSEIRFFDANDGGGTEFVTGTAAENIIPIQDIEYFNASGYPGGENPTLIFDNNTGTKYLNVDGQSSAGAAGPSRPGFIVTPQIGKTMPDGFRITTANDDEQRDPASYEIYGTNDDITSTDNSFGDQENWTLIQSGSLALPTERQTVGDTITLTGQTEPYKSYKVEFPTLKGPPAEENLFQIAEFEFIEATSATVEVNRQTGNVTLTATDNITFDSIDIQSVVGGGLVVSEWNSYTDGSVNSDDDTWTTDAANGALLSEMGDGDGVTLTNGSSINLGNIWGALTPDLEDLTVALRTDDGAALGVDVTYVGTELVLGDYSRDGLVTAADWPFFRDVLGGDYEGETEGVAYLGGDLDGDFDSDLDDFNLFLDIFFAAGNSSLELNTVPEPSSVAMVLGAVVAVVGIRRFSRRGLAVLIAVFTFVGAATQVEAQTFTLNNTIVPTVTIPEGQENETEVSGPENFFDDVALDDPLDNDLFVADYNGEGVISNQYAGLGAAPKVIFMDYGTSINPNWFAYAQRSGADPTADRVGRFEFWFSNTDFAGTLPGTDPDAVLQLDPDDERLRDSLLRPYTLGSDSLSGRYVAMRLTVSELSANQPVNNIGGHEFRFLDGPSDVVLTVNYDTLELTLSNNGSSAQAIEMQAYQIESGSNVFDPSAFNGLAGDVAGFNPGNGSSDGWETTGNSAKRLIEANFFATDDLPTGISNISLGTALLPDVFAGDVSFTWTNSFGDIFDGRVEFVGTPPPTGLAGDFNDDGVVNIGDYTVWRNNLGAAESVLPPGSGDGSTIVDAGDYTLWKENFGAMSPAAVAGVTAAVPEPTAWMAMLTAAAVLCLATSRVKAKK